MMRLLVVAALSAALLGPTSAFAELKKGDRIVFLGDSITQAGARPGGYVTLVRKAIEKRYPEHGIEVIGAGISGNRVPDLEKRLERDVLDRKPTIVVVYIGINDVWHTPKGRGTPRDEYEAGLTRIVKQIQDSGAKVILCTPSVIGEQGKLANSLDGLLEEFCGVSRKVAANTGSQLLDLRQRFLAHLAEKNAQDVEKGVLTSDGVHLNAAGNRFVAEAMLDALGAREQGETVMWKENGVLRHVVLFAFKEDLTKDQVREIEDAFRALPGKIKEIAGFEYGTNVSPEDHAEGFTHCFLVTFRNAKDRDAYLPHPAHREFVKLIRPWMTKVLVVDYWAKK